jgi:putative oxidoreductase
MTGAANWIALLGRVVMAAFFIHAGIGKAMNPSGTMAAFARVGTPMPGASYALAIAVEIGIGLLLLLGFRVRISALILAAWCVATAFIAHYHPGDTNNMIHFAKNFAIAGGLLQVVAFGAGRFSLDRR